MAFPLDATIWKAVVDTMQEGVMLVDAGGNIVFVNQAFERLFGYRADEVVGRSCEIFQCDRCFKARADGLDKYCVLFKKEKVRSSECVFRRKDGKPIHLLKNANVIRDASGTVVGGVETLVDLSRVVAGERMIRTLRRQLRRHSGQRVMIGRSPAMLQVFDLAAHAAESDAPVVIYGESGTGKELLATMLHEQSPRADGPFIKVNCAALNENLLESELFGHVKGAFTGAEQMRIGRFEAAHGGTIFLDEIGDLPMSTQTKLLRVLQEKEIERVGDHRPIGIDVRVITATHKDLPELIDSGEFREDLYYRINVIPITLPPLRERTGDLPLLVDAAVANASKRTGGKIRGVSGAALEVMQRYHWPGNVRELINVIEYAFVVCRHDEIGPEHLPPALTDAAPPPTGAGRRPEAERVREIEAALRRCKWNRTQAARLLGVSRVTLWKWMKRYGMG